MALKLYFDLMSQPSRSLYILLKSIKCNFESCYVDLRKGEHFSEEYTSKVNRLQKVPVIDYNGFILTESVAILQFLSRENIIPESLFPKQSLQRARLEEYLNWQHIGLRLHCSMFFRVKHMDPILTGQKANPKRVASYENRMKRALEEFSTQWLGRGTPFILGNSATVADLWAACELEQPRMADFDPMERYPAIGEWMPKVRAHFSPYYEEAHVTLNKIVSKQQKAKLTNKL